MNESDLFSEVRMATIGVADLDQARNFYTAALGYEPSEFGRVAAPVAEFWASPDQLAIDYCVMAADETGRGRIRLVSADAPGQQLFTPSNRMSATGCYALNFRTRDIHRQLAEIRSAGGQVGDEPHFWEVNDQVHVYDSMSSDPDGTCLDLFSYARGGELRGELSTQVSVIQTVALAVADARRSRDFYRRLGFLELFDRELDFPGLQDMLGIDRPVRIHNINLIKNGDIVPGRVEMFCYLDTGEEPAPLTGHAHPPNHGILSFSIETSHLDQALEVITAAGGDPVASLNAPAELPGFGAARGVMVLGPDGERIELVERMERAS